MAKNPQDKFLKACSSGDLLAAQSLLSSADPKDSESKAFGVALTNGHVDLAVWLLPLSDPRSVLYFLIGLSLQSSHYETMKKLIPRLSQKLLGDLTAPLLYQHANSQILELLLPVSGLTPQEIVQAFESAARNGNKDLVEILLPYSDPSLNYSSALASASEYGHLDIVKILAPLSNPKELSSCALRAAAAKQHADIVAFLWDVSEPELALSAAKRTGAPPEGYRLIEDRLILEKNRHELMTAAQAINKTTTRKINKM